MKVDSTTGGMQNLTAMPGAQSAVIKHRGHSAGPRKAFSLEELSPQTDVSSAPADDAGTSIISDDEKNFFEGLFPASAGAIRTYSPYQRNGMKQTPIVGSLVDLKG